MSIPLNSSWTWRVYLGEDIICNNSCLDTDIIIIEARMWRDQTSWRYWHIWVQVSNLTITSRIWHTSYSSRWLEFLVNNANKQWFYSWIWTWFRDYRLTYNSTTWEVKWECWEVLDTTNKLYDQTFQDDWIKWLPIERLHFSWWEWTYYNHWQFDWIRIKDKNWNILSYVDFNDNQFPSWYKLIDQNNNIQTDWYTISNWILTLWIDSSKTRYLVYNEHWFS